MQWPGSTSDYMAWVTSDLCMSLENNAVSKMILRGYTLVGDNAYVKKPYMTVPLKGKQSGYNDAFNFYQSQLRITIERAFGVFVHRWAKLRGPLAIPPSKVAPFITCLCRLHNFCIDENQTKLNEIEEKMPSALKGTSKLRRELGLRLDPSSPSTRMVGPRIFSTWGIIFWMPTTIATRMATTKERHSQWTRCCAKLGLNIYSVLVNFIILSRLVTQ